METKATEPIRTADGQTRYCKQTVERAASFSGGRQDGMSEFKRLVIELSFGLTFLPDKPEETAESTARALWLAATGKLRSAELAVDESLPGLDGESRQRLKILVAQRLSGTPLAHLTQRQSFMGVELLAGPDALIPRKETEILGCAALSKLHELVKHRGKIRVIDVCTGSGNLAVALAAYESQCEVYGIDLSSDAIRLAERNASFHQLSPRVSFRQGDLLTPVATNEFWGSCDFMVCNPPYVSSAKVDELPFETGTHEPRLAFDGGSFGVSIINRLIREAPKFLKPDSWLCFEVGLGQGPYFVRNLRKMSDYRDVETFADSHGIIRAIAAMTN